MANEPNDRNVNLPIVGDKGPTEALDPANQSLSDALTMSFRILKLLMLVLVVLYFLSGWFSVKPNELGVKFRFGRVVGASEREPTSLAILPPGWHWSWPFPFESWKTVASSERQIPIEFMLQLTERERVTGQIEMKFGMLSPERDDYLVTGDANIIHAALTIKYRITNPVDYLANVFPLPAPATTVRSEIYLHYPEYTVIRNIARQAVIETAATAAALDIRGNKQDIFLVQVGQAINRHLKAFTDHGTPLGIEIDENTGVIAPKNNTGTLEAIMPPRQVQADFDAVFAAQTNKAIAIAKAKSDSEALLLNTFGPGHEELSKSLENEFSLIRRISQIEAKANATNSSDLAEAKEQLETQREQTNKLLAGASGFVRIVVQQAEINRDQIVKEASGDYDRFMSVLPEYEKNPDLFISRMLANVYSRSLQSDKITKVYVPADAVQYRLQIPRTTRTLKPEDEKKNAPNTPTGVLMPRARMQ